MFSPLSILTVSNDGGEQSYINNENRSEKKKRDFQGNQNFNEKKDIIIVKN